MGATTGRGGFREEYGAEGGLGFCNLLGGCGGRLVDPGDSGGGSREGGYVPRMGGVDPARGEAGWAPRK